MLPVALYLFKGPLDGQGKNCRKFRLTNEHYASAFARSDINGSSGLPLGDFVYTSCRIWKIVIALFFSGTQLAFACSPPTGNELPLSEIGLGFFEPADAVFVARVLSVNIATVHGKGVMTAELQPLKSLKGDPRNFLHYAKETLHLECSFYNAPDVGRDYLFFVTKRPSGPWFDEWALRDPIRGEVKEVTKLIQILSARRVNGANNGVKKTSR
jgi:hypothetical protein